MDVLVLRSSHHIWEMLLDARDILAGGSAASSSLVERS